MNRLLVHLFFLILILPFEIGAQNGGVYYVSPDTLIANDNNPGTFDQPWRTWQKAFSEAQPGDTVYFRGGVY